MENQENEIIELAEYQPDEVEDEETMEEKSGIGTGMAMLIGSGLTVAGIAAWKFAKKKYGQFKAKRRMVPAEAAEPDEMDGTYYDDEKVVDVDADDENTK